MTRFSQLEMVRCIVVVPHAYFVGGKRMFAMCVGRSLGIETLGFVCTTGRKWEVFAIFICTKMKLLL